MKIVNVKGHDQAVISLLNGDVDAAAVFNDARTVVKKDQPNVFKDTKILKLTKPIPNDTISVRPDMDKKFQDKLKKAFKEISKTKKDIKSLARYILMKVMLILKIQTLISLDNMKKLFMI